MSTTIDQKVVEMKFDNKHFETNIRTTMASLDKLKEKISLKGAKQGLEDVSRAVERVSFDSLDRGITATEQKFDALKVMAIGALMNIGAQIEQTARKLIDDFTLAPIRTGFEEYELKMGSVQTIMASTGADIATVNKYLDELNLYADKTIYSFADMTQNIGKFTNAGVELDKAVLAIKGVSNEAAVSGANANEASRAMYNFAQALSAGYVKLIDWKSIENANMATVEFKNELIKTAEAIGTVKKNADGMYTVLTTDAKGSKMDQAISATRNFNDSLQYQWMTTDVLVDTLARYADETTEIGKKAYAAAQDVKTFSQLLDTLKEAAQSGWTETWQLIIGDFEEAKTLWTEVSNFFGGVIDNMSNARNDFLSGALQKANPSEKQWRSLLMSLPKNARAEFVNSIKEVAKAHDIAIDDMLDGSKTLSEVLSDTWMTSDILSESLKKLEKFTKNYNGEVSKTTTELDKFAKIAKEVWSGKWGNGEDRTKKLKETLGLTAEEVKSVQGLVNKIAKGEKISATDLSNAQKEALGLTKEEIKALEDLYKQAETTGTPIEEIFAQFEKPSGRELLIDTVRNSLKGIVSIIRTVKEAWHDIIPATTSEQLYNFLKMTDDFSKRFLEMDGTLDKIHRTAKGLFSIVDLFRRTAGSLISFLFPKLFNGLDVGANGLLGFTAGIGDMITSFHDWVVENNKIVEGIQTLNTKLESGKAKVRSYFDRIGNTEAGHRISKAFSEMFGTITSKWEALQKLNPEEGLIAFGEAIESFAVQVQSIPIVSSALDNITKSVTNAKSAIKEFGKSALNKFADFFDYISSMDSVNLENVGKAIKYFFDNVLNVSGNLKEAGTTITSFLSNIKESFKSLSPEGGINLDGESVLEKIRSFCDWIFANISNIDTSQVLIYALAGSLLYLVFSVGQVVNASAKFVKAATGLTGSLTKLTDTFNSILENKFLTKKTGFQKFADGLLVIAISFGIIAAAVYIFADMKKKGTLNDGLIALGEVAGMLLMLTTISLLFNKLKIKEEDIKSMGKLMLSIAGSVAILALSLKVISTIDSDKLFTSAIVLTGTMIILVALMERLSKVGPVAKEGAAVMLAFSASILILAVGLKKLDDLNLEHPVKTMALLITSVISMAILIKASKGEIKGAATAIIGISAGLILMTLAIKMIAKVDTNQIKENLDAFIAVFGMIAILMTSTALTGQYAAKGGRAILLISVSLLLIVQAMKQIGKIPADELNKALKAIEILLGTLAGVMMSTKLAGEHAMKAGGAIAIMTASILALTIAVKILGGLNSEELAKGIGAIVILEGMFSLIMYMSQYIEKSASGIMMMATFLGVLTVALVVLTKNVDSKKLLIAVTAISEVLIALGVSMKLIQGFGTEGFTIKMLLVFIIVAALIWKLSETVKNPAAAIGVATAVSIVLVAIADSMAIISKYANKGFKKGTFESLEEMVLVFAEIAVLIGIFAFAVQKLGIDTSLSKTMPMITAMTALVSAIIASMVVIQKLNVSGFKNSLNVLKSLEIMVLIFAEVSILLVGLLWVTQKLDINTSMNKILPLVAGISVIMIALSASMAIICSSGATMGMINPGGVLLGFQVILAIFLEIAVVVDVLGALIDKYPNIEEHLNKGVTIFEAVGKALGALAGGLIEGVGLAVANTLPPFGTAMSEFMKELDGFISGVENLPDDFLVKASLLSGGLLAFSAAEFLSMVLTFDGASFALMGSGLSAFMNNASDFFDGLDVITPEKADACKTVANMLLSLTASTLIDQIAKLLGAGTNPLGTLGNELRDFGPGLAAFAEATSSINGYKLTGVGKAGVALAEFINALPRENGWVQKVIGEHQDLKKLAEGLKEFAPDFVEFVNTVSPLEQDNVDKAVLAGKTLAEFAKAIPNTGGVLAELIGDNDMKTFGDNLKDFGTSIVEFAETTDGLEIEVIQNAKSCADVMVALAKEIPNQHGGKTVLGMLVGDNTMGNFGANLQSLAASLVSVNFLMKSVDEELFGKLKRVGDTMVELSDLAPDRSGIFWTKDGNLETFGSQLKAFGYAMRDVCSTMEGVGTESLNNAVAQIIQLLNVLNGVSTTEATGMESFTEFLKGIGKKAIEGFIKSFSNADSELRAAGSDASQAVIDGMDEKNSAFQTEGTKEVNAYIKFIKDKIDAARAAGYSLASSVLAGMKDIEKASSNFGTAGTNAANQYIKGITDAATNARTAGASLSNNTYNGMTNQSYNELGKRDGKAYSTGFESVNTIDSRNAFSVMASALSLIDDSLLDANTDLTIRPVFDMSEIQNGLPRLNNLLNSATMEDISANVLASRSRSSINQETQLAAMNAMEARYLGAISELKNTEPTPVNVDITLQGDTNKFFRAIKQENDRRIKSTGYNPLNPSYAGGTR